MSRNGCWFDHSWHLPPRTWGGALFGVPPRGLAPRGGANYFPPGAPPHGGEQGPKLLPPTDLRFEDRIHPPEVPGGNTQFLGGNNPNSGGELVFTPRHGGEQAIYPPGSRPTGGSRVQNCSPPQTCVLRIGFTPHNFDNPPPDSPPGCPNSGGGNPPPGVEIPGGDSPVPPRPRG